MATRMIVVNYATKGFYEDHQWRLRNTLLKFGIDHALDLDGTPAVSWVEGCARKAAYCRDVFRQHNGRPVLWLDADALVLQRFDVEDMVPASVLPHRGFAAYSPAWSPGSWNFPLVNSRLLSGTLLFLPHSGTKALLDGWVRRVGADPSAYDQESLYEAVCEWPKARDRFHVLSPRFVCIPDLMPGVVPVVEHTQASRDPRSGK